MMPTWLRRPMGSGYPAQILLGQWLSCALFLTPLASAQIRVMSPKSLVDQLKNDNGRVEGSTSTFGAPFYGDRVLGQLVYGEPSSLKSPHCDEADYNVSAPSRDSNEEAPAHLINIILVRRGGCAFTNKVKVASAKGAHAVLIIDKEDSTYTPKDLQNIIVADDGFGGGISIPSVLISKVDGHRFLDIMRKKGNQVIVELAWNLPTNHVVHIDLWMSSASLESAKFLKEFAPKRRVLNQVVSFTPHYAVFSMDGNKKETDGLCLDKGHFCAESPGAPIFGKTVLQEDLRQLCIHALYQVNRKSDNAIRTGSGGVQYSAQFWDYIEKFIDECPMKLSKNPEDMFGEACSMKVMREVGIDPKMIQECTVKNETEYLKHERVNLAWSPRALRINGWRYSGTLDADLVTRAICTGFIDKPSECEDLIKPRDPTVKYLERPADGITFTQAALTFLMISFMLFVAVLMFKRYLRKEMRSSLREEVMLEVQMQMGEYQRMAYP